MNRSSLAAGIVAFGLVVAGCAPSGGDGASPKDLAGTSWLAKDIEGQAVTDGVQSTLTFSDDGTISGKGGCNRYFGSFTEASGALSFGQIGVTQMACPPEQMDQEQRFLRALGEVKRQRMQEGMLILFGDGADPIVRLTPLPATPPS